MPLGLTDWASIAAIVSAMCDVISTGRDTFQAFYESRRTSPDILQQAATLRQAMSTYSDEEVEAIRERLQGCRDRFVEEGSGQQRKRCLCSVLRDVKDGNGATIPFNDWEQTYETLGCGVEVFVTRFVPPRLTVRSANRGIALWPPSPSVESLSVSHEQRVATEIRIQRIRVGVCSCPVALRVERWSRRDVDRKIGKQWCDRPTDLRSFDLVTQQYGFSETA